MQRRAEEPLSHLLISYIKISCSNLSTVLFSIDFSEMKIMPIVLVALTANHSTLLISCDHAMYLNLWVSAEQYLLLWVFTCNLKSFVVCKISSPLAGLTSMHCFIKSAMKLFNHNVVSVLTLLRYWDFYDFMPVCMNCCYTPVSCNNPLQDRHGNTSAGTSVLFNVSSERKRLALFRFLFDKEPLDICSLLIK
jgi:hypothetical protein